MPLKEYDQYYNSDIIHTVEVYLENNGDYKKTAQILHQHENTVRYRILKAKKLIDLENEHLKFIEQVSLALKMDKIMNIESKSENTLMAESGPVSDLIDYQSSSVVSRTIIERNAGSVTLFSFDKGQGLSEHTAPFDALVHIIDGEADITISGRCIGVKKGEAVIMPANKPHALKAVERFKMMLVMIKGS